MMAKHHQPLNFSLCFLLWPGRHVPLTPIHKVSTLEAQSP